MSKNTSVQRAKAQRAGDKPVLDLREFVPYQLTFLAGSVARALGGTMEARFGLNSAQWRIMAILGTFSPLSTFEIASRTSLEKSAVSRTISELIARGLIVRAINPTDRRLLMLRFSPKGRQHFERMAAVGLQYEQFLLSHVPAELRRTLAKTLSILHEASLEYEAANGDDGRARSGSVRASRRRSRDIAK